jgi:radical SAM protein with 4Fe4S-binding SPASM domain
MLKKLIYKLVPRNIRISAKRIYYFLSGFFKEDTFGIINIETTTYCNLRCKFCPNSKYERGLLKNKKLMEEGLFKKIINELSENNFSGTISLQLYGEPLSDERVPEFIKYIREKCPNSWITINSNGFFLTIELYEKLLESGSDNLLITQYTNVIQPNYKIVSEYLKDKPEKNKITYRILDGSVGSDAIYNRGGEIKLDRLPDLPSCVYPVKVVHINYRGEVLICGHDYHGKIVLGDTNKENLYAIWKSQEYTKLRKELNHFNFKYDLCKRCVGI